MDDIEWLENDVNECRMMGMRLEWDGCQGWLENDVNECWMMGMRLEWDGWHRMTGKWCEWVLNDGNEARMRWMT